MVFSALLGSSTDTYDPKTLRIASIRTTNGQSQVLQDLAYSFDAIGNLTSLTDRWNSATQTFQYDPLNRLKAATGSYGAYQYRFNAIGNVLQKDTAATLTYGKTTGTPIPPCGHQESQRPGYNNSDLRRQR